MSEDIVGLSLPADNSNAESLKRQFDSNPGVIIQALQTESTDLGFRKWEQLAAQALDEVGAIVIAHEVVHYLGGRHVGKYKANDDDGFNVETNNIMQPIGNKVFKLPQYLNDRQIKLIRESSVFNGM
jgi:hypothetical protein